MRDKLATIYKAMERDRSWHPGLVYERFAPVAEEKLRVELVDRWLARLGNTQVSPEYADYFRRWRASFGEADTRCRTCRATSRLHVGHGNPSGSEVGLTVQHTWGVPVIPGSALKGLLAHRVARLYGARAGEDEPEREPWRGVTWTGKRITQGPGELYRVLFGAPDADGESREGAQALATGACAGMVVFHDALYVPGSCDGDQPFARDVLTVHHKEYYNARGETAPNDYDDPNPVGFLNVKPGAQFLVAVSGPSDWADLAMALLLEALDEWGIGGKTSLGYGQLVPIEDAVEQAVIASDSAGSGERQEDAPDASTEFHTFEVELKDNSRKVRDVLADVVARWPERLLALHGREQGLAASRLERKMRGLKKGRDDELTRSLNEIIARLRGDPTV